MTSFVGRRHELAETKRLLAAGRMVTLTGVGGVGKTRLAMRVAAEMSRAFPDGMWLIDLASLTAEELLTETISETIGCHHPDVAALSEHLSGKRLLLVLDNCEHLLIECAILAGKLLSAAPELRILATSRQSLQVQSEHLLEVPPLTVSGVDETVLADAEARYEAVRLFADRVAAVVPGFTVNEANSVAVTQLCRRLDGIPLAIELAAVRMRALSVEQILERLNDRFQLLSRGHMVAVPRQRTLQTLVDWSHHLCSPEERTLWERLSVFSGGCDLEAVEEVCSGDGIAREDIPHVLAELVDKSILRRKAQGSGMRYEMLETLRQYGWERIASPRQKTALRLRHRDWCRDLAARAEAEWFGEHQMEWLVRIRQEQANVRAALEFCSSEPGQAWAGLEIAAAMWSHRLSWSSPSEGHHWLERALAQEPGPSAERAKALWVDAWLVLLQGDPKAARPLLQESRALAERLGDEAQLAGTVHITGFAALLAGDFARAFTLLEEAVTRRRALGHPGHAWVALFQLSIAAVLMGDARSTALCQETLEISRRVNADWSVSYGLWVTALDRWRRGDPGTALPMMRDALRLKLRCNDHLGIAQCLEGLAWIVADQQRDKRAAQLLGAAQMVWRSIETSLSGLGHLAGLHSRCEALLRESLRDEAFTEAFTYGSALTLDQAVAHALEEKPSRDAGSPQPESDVASVLTRREREIAELVAQGLSNKQIAETLVIAQRTAEGHVENILRKLSFTSRSQVAKAWSSRQRAGRQ
ncbi:LuxR C-terminal-related transcriptional regulator [Nonomuraea sp. NPDC049269]|uniref:LuxR C-terminal-related transcriptional regulator n=1 Tax=Nonomuraea sp. NPDC049269 TaxID=3364349 RepID=UPI00371A08B8